MKRDVKLLIFWEGFPACGLLLFQVVKNFKDVVITATRPSVPFENLEEKLGHEIVWLENADDIYKRKDEFSDRDFILHTGWVHKGWLKFDKYIREKNNAKVVVVVDNNFKKNLRQLLGAIYFRVVLKKYFDGAFVPGREGQKLLKFFGMAESKIYVGNYGAFEEVYKDTNPIQNRKDEFLYVGQLNKRKSVDIIVKAYKKYRENGGKWSLRILGSGELADICQGDGIVYEGFTQPHKVMQKMNNAKVLLLISREDHWGTVVCEAAACGMNLITAKNVGSTVDIIRDNINGVVLDKIRSEHLVNIFKYYEEIDEEMIVNGSAVSKSIARGYDSFAYYTALSKMIYDLKK
jgi:glycosyltransferase involved in cell wall biosynthesis